VENECAYDKMQQPQFLAPYVKYSFQNCVRRTYDATKRLISVVELILKFPSMSTSYYSSSTGTAARCGLWPIEQDPSIFPYLSPTLSIIVKSIQHFPLFYFRNNKFFTVWDC
jgi:hypothetical protein